MKNIVVSRIRQFIREDWLRKIIAVFFAVLIYVTGMESISEEKTWHNIPVEVSLPAGLVDTNPKPIFVSVTVRGSKRNLRNQDKLSGKVQVLERKFVNGEPYRLTISPDNFAPVKGVRVVSVDFKDQIHSLMLQRQVTRRLPVRAVFTGELPADFACDKVVCIPQDVEVIGPESLVCDLTDVVTEAIPLDSSLTESFSIKTKLRNPNALTIGAKNDSVEVQVTVVRKFTEKKFRNIPLQIQYTVGHPRESSLSADTAVDVVVRGPLKEVKALKPEMIHPLINLAAGTPGQKNKLKIEGYVAVEGVEIKSVEPSQIEVKILK